MQSDKILSNPLCQPFDTHEGVPPYGRFDESAYKDAIEYGIACRNRAIEAICSNPDTPDFENTIVALERSGSELDRVLGVFYPALSAMSTPELMELSPALLARLSSSGLDVILNPRLWERVKTVHDQATGLTEEQQRLLQSTYDGFVRGGALLEGADRERFREISVRLSELSNQFGQNVLLEINSTSVLASADEIIGLPDDVAADAASLAAGHGHQGEYELTMHQPVYMAVMRHADNRTLRERMWRAYMGRNMSGERDNRPIVVEMVKLRAEKARLMDYENYAEYVLTDTMARTQEAVYDLLGRLRDAYIEPGRAEVARLGKFASAYTPNPLDGTLEPWDYSYYADKERDTLFSYDVEAMRPYFPLDSVITGVFGLANKLYGITLTERHDLPVYHPDVRTFEVDDADGSKLGILYADFFPRDTKRPGAWMTDLREQHTGADGTDIRPVVSLVMNFKKPAADRPSLLSPDEVRTLMHEFGHALHSLFSRVNYASLAGTSVYRDFVELPSQFNENFLTQREFLDSFARHYLTGEPIPTSFVDGIVDSSRYAAAYACLRQLSFGFTDMRWHTMTADQAAKLTPDDVASVELEAMASTALFAQRPEAIMSVSFSHIFSGGYASGYYSYKWAEVLDADAFEAFAGDGVFSRRLAESFRHGILERGNTRHPADLYRDWRGRDASIEALMRRDGII